MLSPADHGFKDSWIYVLFTATIRGDASYIRVLRELDRCSRIVSHDEESRRIVVKTPLGSVGEASLILKRFAGSVSAEVKLGCPLPRGKLLRRCLESSGFTASMHVNRILAYKVFDDSTILAEILPGRLLAKYGRRILPRRLLPAELPPMLFTFMLHELSPGLLSSARLRFMNIRDNIIRCIQGNMG